MAKYEKQSNETMVWLPKCNKMVSFNSQGFAEVEDKSEIKEMQQYGYKDISILSQTSLLNNEPVISKPKQATK